MHRVRRREWYVCLCLCLCLCLCVWWWWWWWCESKRVTRLLYVSEVFFSCWCLWRVLCLCMTHPLTGRIEARALVDSELDGSEQQVSGWQFEWCALQAVLWVVVFLFYFIFVCTRSLFLSFFFLLNSTRDCVCTRAIYDCCCTSSRRLLMASIDSGNTRGTRGFAWGCPQSYHCAYALISPVNKQKWTERTEEKITLFMCATRSTGRLCYGLCRF